MFKYLYLTVTTKVALTVLRVLHSSIENKSKNTFGMLMQCKHKQFLISSGTLWNVMSAQILMFYVNELLVILMTEGCIIRKFLCYLQP